MSTANLVKNHAKVIERLDKEGLLTQPQCNYLLMPFESYESSLFREFKRSGKSVLTNASGDIVQFADVNVERAIHVAIKRENKVKIIQVNNDDVNPNLVFFHQVDTLTHENAALITDLSFQLWMLIKTKQLTNKQLSSLLQKLTAVLIAHIKKNDMPTLVKTLLYTSPENGEFLAPIAALQDNLPKPVLDDFKIVIDTGDLPQQIVRISVEAFTQMRKNSKEYRNRALGELREAVYDPKNSKRAAEILKKYFNMSTVQALDFMQLNKRSADEEVIDVAEDLINNTLRYVAAEQEPQLSQDDKRDILSDNLVEAFSNRLA